MTKAIASEHDVDQSRIFVQNLKHNCFNWLREEVFSQLYMADQLIRLKSINNVQQSSIIKTAWRKVKLLKFASRLAVFSGNNLGK